MALPPPLQIKIVPAKLQVGGVVMTTTTLSGATDLLGDVGEMEQSAAAAMVMGGEEAEGEVGPEVLLYHRPGEDIYIIDHHFIIVYSFTFSYQSIMFSFQVYYYPIKVYLVSYHSKLYSNQSILIFISKYIILQSILVLILKYTILQSQYTFLSCQSILYTKEYLFPYQSILYSNQSI